MRKIGIALLTAIVAGCAPQPQPPAAAAAPPPPPPTQAATGPAIPARSDAQVASGRWDVARVRCSDLVGASDEDRAAVAMFYYGYHAAKAGIRIVDVAQIDDNLKKAMDRCGAAPATTVVQAFRHAVR